MDEIAEYARTRIEKGSKSFAAASRIFGPNTRASVHMLYCWCRHCDDEVDDQELGFASGQDPASTEERLRALESKTRAAMAGEASEPEFIALAHVMQRHQIPDILPLEHLAGFAMDAAGTRYRTLDDTLKYCWHVAGAVGVMMALVLGARDSRALERACDLGIAFQLTNLARDVMDDAATGRVYLPEDWLAAENVRPEDIAAADNRDAVHRVTVRLLDEADRYYASAGYGLAMLPIRAAIAIGAALSIYREIGSLARRKGSRACDQRAIVGTTGKLLALLNGAGQAALSHTRAAVSAPPPRPDLYRPQILGDL